MFYPTAKSFSICKEPFSILLDICIRLYQKLRSNYTIVWHVESVAQKCEKRKMTFSSVDNSSNAPESPKNVSIDVEMVRCPIKELNFKFLANADPELEDFYITEVTDLRTYGVLRNSTSSDNVCLTNLFKLKM